MKIWFAAALLLMAPAQAFAEGEPLPPPPVPKTKAASNDISGRWLYRSVQNNPDFDATPESLRLAVAVLDIKPYVGEFDIRPVERIGWFADNLYKLDKTKDDGRFTKK